MNENYKKIAEILKEKGFKKIYLDDAITPYFKWTFDIFAESKNNAVGLEYRKDENISDLFLENILSIKKFFKKLLIYIIYERKPQRSTIDTLSQNGIGIMIFKNNTLFILQDSKDFSKEKVKKTKKEIKTMHQFYLYPASCQYETPKRIPCKERQLIHEIVSDFNRRNTVPIHVKRPEKDKRFGKDFKKSMRVNIDESKIFIAVLKEEYSENVEYEIRKAAKNIKEKRLNKKLTLFLRRDIPETKFDKKQLKLIKFVETIDKHLPYSNKEDFKDVLIQNLIGMINLMYHKEKIKSPLEIAAS